MAAEPGGDHPVERSVGQHPRQPGEHGSVPPEAAERAAARFQDEFLAIVTDVVGEPNAQHYGALLLAGGHGIAGMEHSGHLGADKWRTTAGDLVDTLIRVAAAAP